MASPDKTPPSYEREARKAIRLAVQRAERAEAEAVRLRGNRDFLEQHVLRLEAMLGERDVRVERLREALRAADAVVAWLADNYPKAIRELPTPLYHELRRARDAVVASPDKPPEVFEPPSEDMGG